MTPQQIRLIRTSFEPLKPLAGTVAEAFYAQLFARDPARFAKASEALVARQHALSAAEDEWLRLEELREAAGG